VVKTEGGRIMGGECSWDKHLIILLNIT